MMLIDGALKLLQLVTIAIARLLQMILNPGGLALNILFMLEYVYDSEYDVRKLVRRKSGLSFIVLLELGISFFELKISHQAMNSLEGKLFNLISKFIHVRISLNILLRFLGKINMMNNLIRINSRIELMRDPIIFTFHCLLGTPCP
ncbi:hypothetical protein Syun_030596 [Stephania yunnanensis]|uniref:Uncharacterized protein n=1 Tax=Stephania yunnanensis TaxID=152371 RepID=A0AAP0E1X9_9MAGN